MLHIEQLYKKLGEFKLRDINLKIRNGEYFVVLGPTGTGKTLLLETIAGMYKPDKGNIFLDGKNLVTVPPENRNIGFVYQDYGLFPHLTVRENIVFGLKVRKTHENIIKRHLDEIVALFEIKHLLSRYPTTLSGGEKQRVAIARALIIKPRILLMDEPLSALDPATKNKLQNMLKKIHNKIGTTTIHITHDFNEGLYLADRIAVMKDGEIAQIGTPEEIFRRPNSVFVANFIGMENILKGRVVDNKVILSSDVELKVSTSKRGAVNLIIRPENVSITKEFSKLNDKKGFYGRIENIIYQGHLCKLVVDIGIKITSFISIKDFQNMDMKLGDTVEVFIENNALYIF